MGRERSLGQCCLAKFTQKKEIKLEEEIAFKTISVLLWYNAFQMECFSNPLPIKTFGKPQPYSGRAEELLSKAVRLAMNCCPFEYYSVVTVLL